MNFLAVILVATLFALCGCSRNGAVPQKTARVYAAADVVATVPGAITGDTAYAQVNSAWLKSFYDEFRAEIFRQGVTKWDERFDCNHFAGYYVALAQTRFYLANFQSRTPAQSLAVGTYWYRPTPTTGHAIVCALTERGLLLIEPQTGAEVVLTNAEKQSAFLRVF